MATNIEMNYYNGSSYISLRPMGNLSNMEGSLTADQIPNLDMAKITTGNLAGSRISGYVSNASYATNSGKLGGYTYSQVISNASSGGGMNVSKGDLAPTMTGAVTINWANFVGKLGIIMKDGNYSNRSSALIISSPGIKCSMGLTVNHGNSNYVNFQNISITWGSYSLTVPSGWLNSTSSSDSISYIILG